MKKKRLLTHMLTMGLALSLLSGCTTTSTQNDASGLAQSAQSGSAREVLRVGMECAYAPFNWTQESDNLPDGSAAGRRHLTARFIT